MLIDQLEDIKILGAANLNETNFACYMGAGLNPKSMNVHYDKETDILKITPISNLSFSDIGFVKFGNTKADPHVCDPTSFAWYSEEIVDLKNDTYRAFNLTPTPYYTSVLEPLVATALLMDDEGSINFNVTS